ncbi:hypothetical protein GCWU000325_02200 [Alloprevotella tannerae ATCC 51259]|uniref:Uncharacterized protein n=1 Tax=Alloprevotella tannerae ATCC 51259 TaxID=626522 RepID=C9LIY9_9BACT|nr:hypothetical protein GCWU000325_02200 [Alloprevotella tannerae ATCC 51259]
MKKITVFSSGILTRSRSKYIVKDKATQNTLYIITFRLKRRMNYKGTYFKEHYPSVGTLSRRSSTG